VNNQTNKPEKEKGKFDGWKEEGEKVQKHTHPKRKKGREKKKQLLLLVGLALVTSIEC